MKWTGFWAVLDITTTQYVDSFPTKTEAMKVVSGLNEKEVRARRYKKYGVVPLTSEKLNALRKQEAVS